MSLPSTEFNPFGRHKDQLTSLKTEMEEIATKFNEKGVSKIQGFSEDVKKYTKISEQLTEIAKDISEHAILTLISEIALPLSKFITVLGESEDLKSAEFKSLYPKMNIFIQVVADRVRKEPFNSDVLQQWSPVFESFLAGKHNSLKELGSKLWKSSFGNIKTPIVWPVTLRKTLEKVPKRHGLHLPPAAKSTESEPIYADDDVMDVFPISPEKFSNNFKPPKSKETKEELTESQSSFQLSQQPIADEMAEKLLNDRKLKAEATHSPKITHKGTPTSSRKRAAKISLIDEDSCDFVAIVATPPSGRKNRLTDRQKEKLVEASGPRTSINYMDEESQSGFQKSEKLKKALAEMNFDVGEDSVSVPVSKKTEEIDESPTKTSSSSAPEVAEEPETSSQTARIPSKRSRRLFNDSPVKAFAIGSSKNPDFVADDEDTVKLDKIPNLAETSPISPPAKRVKKEEDSTIEIVKTSSSNSPSSESESSVKNTENSEDVVCDEVEKPAEDKMPSKRRGRPKKTPKQCLPAQPTQNSRKSSRLVSVKEVTSSERKSSESSDSSEIVGKLDDSKYSIFHEESKILPDPVSEASINSESTVSVEVRSEPAPIDTLDSDVVKSPPKTPRTPSILRVGKRIGSSSSPMTERKKNRVHFGEDSLPQETISSPLTPRRRPFVEKTSSSSSFSSEFSSSTISPTNSLLEIQSLTASMHSPFFPALIDCQDKIDRMIPHLVPLCRKTYMDSAKKSLHGVGVKTIGDFAALPKSQIEKFTWIKGKVVGAKNALMQHEKTWNPDQRVVEEDEEHIVDDVTNMKAAEKLTEVISSKSDASEESVSIEKISQDEAVSTTPEKSVTADRTTEDSSPVPMETDDTTVPEIVQKTPETVSSTKEALSTLQNAPAILSPEPTVSPQKTPEASQSPASPISTTTSSAVSTVTQATGKMLKDASAVSSRKNLAPIFYGRSKEIKKEEESPQKVVAKPKEDSASSFTEDSRLLHRICTNLSHAHAKNQWPAENTQKLLSKINKAQIFFKNLVQTRGAGDWDDMDFENEDVATVEDKVVVEDDVDALVGIYKRFSRQHTSPKANNLPWLSVMECINEAACILESIFLARAPTL